MTNTASMAHTPSRTKRPYVRPQIGKSVFRSLWYLFALLGLVVVAFVLPRSPPPQRSVTGDWRFEVPTTMAGLPAGTMTLLAHGGHYTLDFETPDGNVGLEIGHLEEGDGRLEMTPVRSVILDAAGVGRRDRPLPRSFSMRFEDDTMVLTDPSGVKIRCQPYSFSVD